jgi:hypothetical protein
MSKKNIKKAPVIVEEKTATPKAPVNPEQKTATPKAPVTVEEKTAAPKAPVIVEEKTAEPLSEFLLAAQNEGKKIVTVTDPKGKQIKAVEVEPGVVQKTASIFYIHDSVSDEWLYCFPERYERMKKKGVDFTNYMGRSSKAAARETAAKDRIFVRAEKARQRYEELQKLAEAEREKRKAAEKIGEKAADTSETTEAEPTQVAAK